MPVIYLTTGTATWTVPDDCVQAVVDTLGAGSGGASAAGGAGGGGAWARSILNIAPRAVINVGIGAGGAAGQAGGATWFNATSLANAVANGNTVSCAAAGAAPPGGGGATGALGGTAAASVGTSKNNGGNGGSVSTDGGGGGGAGGPNGAGNNGVNGSGTSGGVGGQGDGTSGGTGGTGGTAGANPGNPGTEYDASHGSGGGGGGCSTGTAGAGGNYGAGGGGAAVGTGGVGANGLIVITYVSVFVNKKASWNFGGQDSYDDISLWSSVSRPYNHSIAVSILPKTVLRPSFYAPRPSDDFAWLAKPTSSALLLPLLTNVKFFGQGGQSPTKQWHYDYDVGESLWLGRSTRSALLAPLLTAAGQAKPWRWSYTIDDAAPWSLTTERNRSLLAPAGNPFVNLPWSKSSDDATVWYQTIERNRSLLAPAAVTPFVSAPWVPSSDSSTFWQFQAPFNLAVASSIQLPTTQTWTYSVEDSAAGWQRAVTRNISLLGASASPATPFASYQWQPTGDNQVSWQGSPLGYNQNLAQSLLPKTVLRPPFVVPRPSDDFTWPSKPTASALLAPLLTSAGQAKARQWLFGYDDASGWQYSSVQNRIALQPVATSPFSTIPWKFGSDDPVGWQSVRGRNSALFQSVAPVPFIPVQWKFAVEDASGWQGHQSSSALLAPLLTAGGQVKSREWLFGFYDSPHWQVRLSQNFAISLPPIGKPAVSLQWLFGYEDGASWQRWPFYNFNLSPPLPPTPPPVVIPPGGGGHRRKRKPVRPIWDVVKYGDGAREQTAIAPTQAPAAGPTVLENRPDIKTVLDDLNREIQVAALGLEIRKLRAEVTASKPQPTTPATKPAVTLKPNVVYSPAVGSAYVELGNDIVSSRGTANIKGRGYINEGQGKLSSTADVFDNAEDELALEAIEQAEDAERQMLLDIVTKIHQASELKDLLAIVAELE